MFKQINMKNKYILFSALSLARKIYLNSYECMWNDAMKSAGQRNFFYFNNPEMAKKVTETGKKIMKEMLEHFNLDRDGNEIKTNNNETD